MCCLELLFNNSGCKQDINSIGETMMSKVRKDTNELKGVGKQNYTDITTLVM